MPAQYSPPASSAILEWEQAGSLLSSALEKYLLLSESLGNIQLERTHTRHLTTRIDRALHTLHPVLSRQLTQARSTLARARNRLASVTYCLPQEILAEIFAAVLYSGPRTNQNTPHCIPMESTILNMFRNSYSLQSVCSAWRAIILSHGMFWYFAPIYYAETPSLRCIRAPNLSLERSNQDLYLAAVTTLGAPAAFDNFPLSHRFRKVNLFAEARSMVGSFIHKLLRPGPPFTVSELSLYDRTDDNEVDEEDILQALSSSSSLWSPFCELLKSLSVFRVRGTQFHWNQMTFSHRLVEARFQDVRMGSDRGDFVQFLRVLSTAPNLRNLKIISVKSEFDPESMTAVSPEVQIRFPSLETLFLEDLVYHTLLTAMYYIASNSHRLALYLTKHGSVPDVVDPPESRLESLMAHLEDIHVDELILPEDRANWISSFELRDLLGWVPELDSLKLDGGILGEKECHAIMRSPVWEAEPADEEFPRLEYLHLSRVQITDETCLKELVISHSLRKMVLGGYIRSGAVEPPEFEPLRGDEPIVEWLRINVPDFTLTGEHAQPLEYASSVWQLW